MDQVDLLARGQHACCVRRSCDDGPHGPTDFGCIKSVQHLSQMVPGRAGLVARSHLVEELARGVFRRSPGAVCRYSAVSSRMRGSSGRLGSMCRRLRQLAAGSHRGAPVGSVPVVGSTRTRIPHIRQTSTRFENVFLPSNAAQKRVVSAPQFVLEDERRLLFLSMQLRVKSIVRYIIQSVETGFSECAGDWNG